MDNAPAILSIGVPPDRHAERVTDEMLRWLYERSPEWGHRGDRVLVLDKMGNPAAQKKAVAKLDRALDSLLLMPSDLTTGKRGRFKLISTIWAPWDPNAGDFADGPIMPSALWIVVATLVHTGLGDYRIKTRCYTTLAVTRHAIVRLAQRAGLRTVEHLLVALGAIWLACEHLLLKGYEALDAEGVASWTVPLPTRDHKPALFAVIELERVERQQLVVKTILTADMLGGRSD